MKTARVALLTLAFLAAAPFHPSAVAQNWPTKPVKVIGFSDAGPAALLACAIASDHVTRAAIDLNQFDFDQISRDTDPMLLPGALKYGGIYAFVPLCEKGDTLLVNARKTGKFDLAKKTQGVTLSEEKKSGKELAEWIVK